MTNLPYVLQLLNNEKITGDQTMIIDAALSSINPKEIPDIDTSNVIDYIDAQLKI